VKQINTFENCIQSIIALEPCYGQHGGNTTRVYTRQGETIIDNRRLLTLLKKFLKIYGYDLKELRKHYGRYLGCGQSVPLPISRNLVLVQLKMRQPLVENDGASGYVSVTDVVKISALDLNLKANLHKCLLHLTGGVTVPCCLTPRCVEKRLMNGRLALDHYRYLHDATGLQQLQVAEKAEPAPDLQAKISTISSFIYQLLSEVKV
jgi:hypothetical protein